MRKTTIVLALLLASAAVCEPVRAQISPEALRIVQGSYARVQSFEPTPGVEEVPASVGYPGKAAGEGSGLRLPGGWILTAGHMIGLNQSLVADGKESEAVIVFPRRDLMLVRGDSAKKDHEFYFADAQVGEVVFTYANDAGLNGFFRTYLVSKVDEDWVYLDRPLMPGSSGTAVWNSKGQVVGLADSTAFVGDPPLVGYGRAVPSARIKEFLAKNIPKFPT